MLPLHSVAFDTPELFELSRLSYSLYPSWGEGYQTRSGLDPEWENSGSMGLLFSDKEEKNARTLATKLVHLGMEVRWLGGKEACRREPVLPKNIRKVLYLPETAQIYPPVMCRAAEKAVRRVGVTIHSDEPVRSLIIKGGQVQGIKTASKTIDADAVVLATGAWDGRDFWKPLGVDLPVFPLRGQVLLLQGAPIPA